MHPINEADMVRVHSIRSQGLSAPPYLVAWFMALFIMYVSTKANVRGPFIVLVTLVGAAGYLTLALTEVVHARYAAVFLVTMSVSVDRHTSRVFSLIFLCIAALLDDSTRLYVALGQCTGRERE